jgi:hypothetical protein
LIKALATRLLDSGSALLQSALRAFQNEDWTAFVLQSAAALEHLTKARLAAMNPALLADRNHVPSLVWFADESKHTDQYPSELRTISMEFSLELMYRMESDTVKSREAYDDLRRTRNGLAHLGIDAVAQTSRTLLPPVMQGIVILAINLGANAQKLFGDHGSFVASQIRDYVDEEQRRYAGYVAVARIKAEEFERNNSREEAAQWRGLIEVRWRRSTFDDQLVPCPVCGYPAYVTGKLEHTGWETDSDGQEVWSSPVLEYFPQTLKCSTCGLKLDTPHLVDLSSAMDNWTLPDVDMEAATEWIAETDAADYFANLDEGR